MRISIVKQKKNTDKAFVHLDPIMYENYHATQREITEVPTSRCLVTSFEINFAKYEDYDSK